MKQLISGFILVLLCLTEVLAAPYCRPYIDYSSETDAGCNYVFLTTGALSKRVDYSIGWPDGWTQPLDNVAGSGECTATAVCCAQQGVEIECWPLFNTPTRSINGRFTKLLRMPHCFAVGMNEQSW